MEVWAKAVFSKIQDSSSERLEAVGSSKSIKLVPRRAWEDTLRVRDDVSLQEL